MNVHPIVMLIYAGLMNASGTAVMKYAMNYKKADQPNMVIFYLLIVAAMALYGACFPIFANALGRLKLSVGQPVFSATGFLAATVFSLLLFKESISTLQVAGLATIICGIVMVAR